MTEREESRLGYIGSTRAEYKFWIPEDTIEMREGYNRDDIRYYIIELWHTALGYVQEATSEGVKLYFGYTQPGSFLGGSYHAAATDDDLADVVGSCTVKAELTDLFTTWEDSTQL